MESQFPAEVLTRMERSGVVAVLVIDHADDAVPLAQALLEGGIDAMELTLRTPAALESLHRIRRDVPDMLAGIGTILTPEQVAGVVQAGAAFGVAPGTNPRVITAAQQAGLPFAPGVTTASDLEQALELGCRDVKFFPAEPIGGLPYLASMAAPYAHLGVRFIPLGGLKIDNLAQYLEHPLVLAVGGSWLAPRDEIRSHAWDAIRHRASEAKEQVDRIGR